MFEKFIKAFNKHLFFKKKDTEMVQKYMKSHWVSLVLGEVKNQTKVHTQ